MMLDEMVLKAKTECQRFLASPHETKTATAAALTPVISSVKMVLSATNLATGMAKREGVALEVYRAHREMNDVTQVVKVSLTQDGKLLKEDIITCCPKQCNVLAKQAYEVEVIPLLESGIDARKMVECISAFLNDHTLSMVNLGSGLKN
jgi:hypothetical protein